MLSESDLTFSNCASFCLSHLAVTSTQQSPLPGQVSAVSLSRWREWEWKTVLLFNPLFNQTSIEDDYLNSTASDKQRGWFHDKNNVRFLKVNQLTHMPPDTFLFHECVHTVLFRLWRVSERLLNSRLFSCCHHWMLWNMKRKIKWNLRFVLKITGHVIHKH